MTKKNDRALLDAVLADMDAEQKDAIDVLKTFILCYNSRDGIGLFSGITRYAYLASRSQIAGVQSRDLLAFWNRLRHGLAINAVPAKKFDSDIATLWTKSNQHAICSVLATQAIELVMIARMIVDDSKNEPLDEADLQEMGLIADDAVSQAMPTEAQDGQQFNDKIPF